MQRVAQTGYQLGQPLEAVAGSQAESRIWRYPVEETRVQDARQPLFVPVAFPPANRAPQGIQIRG